jgi:outer membrane protein assembly factor BamB
MNAAFFTLHPSLFTFLLAVIAWLTTSTVSLAADWPMWRHDASRSAASPQELAPELRLQWTLRLPELTPAWPDQEMMWFDRNYEPVVAGGLMFVGSSRSDDLAAYEMRTGERRWSFPADGPIRFAPAVWRDQVFAVSDDGYLYCLAAADGKLRWKFRGGPRDRKILGNGRMISTWPARGGPVIADDTVYFAAGIWPFMGIFLHALDAETGEVRWTNDGDGSMYIKQPHNTDSFAGVAPQGALVISGDTLIVPGGRSIPACYDRRTGKFLHYRLADNNKRGGGSAVAASGELIFNGGDAFRMDNGDIVSGFRGFPALRDDTAFVGSGESITTYRFGTPLFETTAGLDRRGRAIKVHKLQVNQPWETDAAAQADLIVAGSRVYACGGGEVTAIDIPTAGKAPSVSWKQAIDGTPLRLVAADDRLLVVTAQGAIHCFGADNRAPVVRSFFPDQIVSNDRAVTHARALLDAAGIHDGHTVVWGAPAPAMLSALAAAERPLLAIVNDHDRALSLRRHCDPLYGPGLQVLEGAPETLELPPYFASLMICEDPAAAGITLDGLCIERLFHSLRPFGGTALFRLNDRQREQLAVAAGKLSKAVVRQSGEYTLLVREGALEGSDDWTHEHADAANSRTSRDQLVKAPLGVLWFGGATHSTILPRHGHGPQPQVIDGRVIQEGPDLLRATDSYTGRVLWERELKDFGKLYDNTSHHPGANGTGGNYVSVSDGIYAIHGSVCLQVDPATGRTLREFAAPATDAASGVIWTYVNVVDDYLVGGFDLLSSEQPKLAYTDYIASKRLAVFNRRSGELLWSLDAEHEFRNNGVCLGGGRLYAIDLLSQYQLEQLKRRGRTTDKPSKLLAVDLSSGAVVWRTDADVFGTWLSYSATHDVLVESGRPGRDVLTDEPAGMRAYQGSDGRVLWKENYRGPAILHGSRILADREACDLLTGKPVLRRDPLTGKEVPWTWVRNYGCNTPQASEHLLLFRSGAAGYYDLAGDGGTGNFGGFRSSCTNNLIAAAGLLNIPEYTRTCTCDYQNQASLALVHLPEVELWTQFVLKDGADIRRLAINFGAPGQRRDAEGQLWLNSHKAAQIEFNGPGYYCRHSSVVESGDLPWVAASGCRGVRRITLDPQATSAGRYTLRLHFCDLDNEQPGARVFDVRVAGKLVLDDFDIVQAAGGGRRAIVREFSGLEIGQRGKLEIEFESRGGAVEASSVPVISGLELRVE